MATYGYEVISVGGHKKTQTYRTVRAFRSTVQNLPLRTRYYAQVGPNNSNSEDEMCKVKVGIIFKLMCPRGTSFSI